MDNVAATFAMSVKLGNKQFVERLTLDFDPTTAEQEVARLNRRLIATRVDRITQPAAIDEVGCLFKFFAGRDFPTRAMRQGFRASSAG